MRLHMIALTTSLCLSGIARGALPEASPESVGLDPARLARIDDVLRQAIEARDVPGAVAIVGRRGKIAYVKVVGQRSLEPSAEPMTRDTLFDMASLTKPMATATSIMILIEQGKLRLDDTLGKLLPEFDVNGKGAITLEQLLRHRSGLIADNPIGDYREGVEEAWKRLANLGLRSAPGSAYVYSDVNFITLGRIVEKFGGAPLDEYARSAIFQPLGMSDTGFRPTQNGQPRPDDVGRIAPTEPDEPGGPMLRGVVHDPRARALGGVAGHAGLFSTADDVAIYAQTLINGGVGPNGTRVLAPLTVRMMTDPADTPRGERRGLGWDVSTSHSAPRGSLFGPNGFGHTGFTGTSLWVDKETGAFVVLLTSRLHPDGAKPAPSRLRSAVATIVASSILDASETPPASPVLCGVDVLARQGFAPLKGKRVGLVTNHTGRTRDGTSTIDALFRADGVRLSALFSPEHGIRGLVDAAVDDSRDEATGLTVHSLYGKTR
ncbi:MAG: serine hydrolase, partial [Isosphaeraceae bacterium]